MAASQQGKESKGGGVLGFLRESAIVIVGALIASTLLRMFLIQVFVIPSGSMENTLLVGDRVAVQKVVPFQRGDIVVFRDDYGWLPTVRGSDDWWKSALTFVGLLPDESQNYLIKRVIGVAGDHVKCCDTLGRITVNDTPLEESAYLYTDPTTGQQVKPSDYTFDVIVPQDKVFVMGDHRNDSQDSRCHLAASYNGVAGGMAFIRTSAIVGTGVATVFPFDRIGGHPGPDAFASVPAPSGSPPAAPVITGPVPVC